MGTAHHHREVGRGTDGNVYRARYPRLDCPVALKLLRRREKGADALESAVIEEGRLMARVRHPNVVTVYGAERIEGRVGLWMEFVGTGRTLEDELRARGRFTAADAIAVGRDFAAALSAVHRAGLLHRDVKAQNAIRNTDGRIVLTDFGAGYEVDEAVNGLEDRRARGDAPLSAPEVLKGGSASVASDLYSLGVVLFRIATASFPVRGRTLEEIRRAHQIRQRRPLAEERPDLPSWLAGVIDTLIRTRPPGAMHHCRDVDSALAASGTPVRVHPSIAQRLRHDWRLMAVAVALVIPATVLASGAWRALSESRVASAPTPWAPLNAGDWIVVADFDNQTARRSSTARLGRPSGANSSIRTSSMSRSALAWETHCGRWTVRLMPASTARWLETCHSVTGACAHSSSGASRRPGTRTTWSQRSWTQGAGPPSRR